jgi:phosphatidylserine/phosphatidylglycerophosphate/cardiolipin synthase-like enzyme
VRNYKKYVVVTILTIFGCLVTASTVFGAPGTSARIVPGEIYLDELSGRLDAVDASVSSIDFFHFNFFTERGAIRKIGEKLKTLKSKHPQIPIRVILEGEKDADMPNGAATRNRLTKEFFEGSGIEVLFASGLRAPGVKGVTHAKAVRIGNYILTGSTNLTNTSVELNNEFDVAVESEIIAGAFHGYVDSILEDSSKLVSLAIGDGPVTLITDAMYFEEGLKIINESKPGDVLDITTYFFANRTPRDAKAKQISDAIVAAFERGVQTRIYLERNSNPDVNPGITRANMQVAENFRLKGIKSIYFDSKEKISHSKIIKRSGPGGKVMLIGSTNLYRGDFDENHQVNFKIEVPELIDQTTNYLNQKIAYEATAYDNMKTGIPPARMIRFWRGFGQNRDRLEALRANVNSALIPETTVVGAQRGLLAYLPAMFAAEKPAFLPDEIALIAYSSEDAYNAIRSTPRGALYGPLHFKEGMFARETPEGYKSTSLVAKAYMGEVLLKSAERPDAPESEAYFIGPATLDWQAGHTVLRTLLSRADLIGDYSTKVQGHLDTLNRNRSRNGVQGAVILVDRDYVFELINFVSKEAAIRGLTVLQLGAESPFTVHQVLDYQSQPAGKTNLEFSAGVSVQFKSELLSLPELLEPVLEPLRPPKPVSKTERLGARVGGLLGKTAAEVGAKKRALSRNVKSIAAFCKGALGSLASKK